VTEYKKGFRLQEQQQQLRTAEAQDEDPGHGEDVEEEGGEDAELQELAGLTTAIQNVKMLAANLTPIIGGKHQTIPLLQPTRRHLRL